MAVYLGGQIQGYSQLLIFPDATSNACSQMTTYSQAAHKSTRNLGFSCPTLYFGQMDPWLAMGRSETTAAG